MLRPIRTALVGCGQIGRLHAERLIADGRAEITALCDPLPANRARLRHDLNIAAPEFDELKPLLNSTPCDAAVVCTPTHLHFEQTRQLRAAGIPVLCEKPLADSRARIVQLIDESRAGGPLVSVAYQRRYWSVFRTLRREVQSGKWGPVDSIVYYNPERWQQTIGGTWRDDPSFNPGGYLGDAGSHKIDMVFYITGLRPVEIFAHGDRRGSHVEIVSSISARLAGGALLNMSFIGNANHYREDLHIHCAEADLLLRDGEVWIGRNNRLEKLEPLEPESNPDAAFLDCVTGQGTNDAPPEVALPVWDFTQAVLESARTGTVMTLEDGAR
jgi:predicted dehydrogenase